MNRTSYPIAREASIATRERGPIAGSGRCKACGCRGYRPNYPKNDYCMDCGHSWYMHEGVGIGN
jgi:hypothetical protein